MNIQKINQIDESIAAYFESHPKTNKIAAKFLMPHFIKAGIFKSDQKEGLPIRKVLRELAAANALHLIPFVIGEKKSVNTNWFFIRVQGKQKTSVLSDAIAKPKVKALEKVIAAKSRANSDESYIIDLCDKVLSQTGSRQHRFDFLLGDASATGRRVKLPVDVFYESLKLAIEFNEQQHTKPVKHFDKPDVMTVSGVHRGEQRRIYDERKKKTLPKHGIQLIHISYDMFECTRSGKIVRNKARDRKIVENTFTKLNLKY